MGTPWGQFCGPEGTARIKNRSFTLCWNLMNVPKRYVFETLSSPLGTYPIPTEGRHTQGIQGKAQRSLGPTFR